jgi:hypothetical protein
MKGQTMTNDERRQQIENLTTRGNKLLGRARDLLEEQRNEIARPALRKLVGKCFRFENSYGSGEKWPLYVRIISFDEKAMTYKTVQFQNTTRQRIEIEYRQEHNFEQHARFGVENGWTPLSEEEYERERKKLLQFVKELLPAQPAGKKAEGT